MRPKDGDGNRGSLDELRSLFPGEGVTDPDGVTVVAPRQSLSLLAYSYPHIC